MIKEVNLYKSIEDYCKNDLHLDFEGYDGYEWMYTSVWLATVCPFCGQEQIIRWDWSREWPCLDDGRLFSDPELKKNSKLLYQKVDEVKNNRQRVGKKILDEMSDYIHNHFECDSCGSALSYRPGYFFSATQYFDYLCLSDYNLPSGYKSDGYSIYFDGYENDELYKKHAFLINGTRQVSRSGIIENIYDSVYDLNSISSEFFSKNKGQKVSIKGKTHIWVLQNGLPTKTYATIDQVFDMLKFYRDYDGFYADAVSSLIDDEKRRLEDTIEVDTIKAELTASQIKDVLKELIGIETTIISLSSRLRKLYLIKDRENSKYLVDTTKKYKNEIDSLEQSIKALEEERTKIENSSVNVNLYSNKVAKNKPRINYPVEPTKPQMPTYETPGLFNKKKVEDANSEKKQKYDADLASYNAALSEYNRLLSEAQKMEKEQKEEIRQEAMILAQEDRNKELADIDAKISDCHSKIESAKSELSRKEIELQTAKDNLSELPWNKEFDQAVELLKKTLEAKIVYEKSEVIFPKYHDLVSYSQFYEYFQAGRCTSLTGPDGAYNLYEAELRQNIIIGKLDDISNSLEDIKQNQFMIYSELKSINSNISKLDDSMNKILGKVTEIGTNVEAIRNSTEIMEENSRIAAYYSKKNAELTNAMGYLVALK